MKQPRDLALRFLRLADRDIGALTVRVGADSLDELNPYGVLLRYEWGDAGMLDRKRALSITTIVRDWTVQLIG